MLDLRHERSSPDRGSRFRRTACAIALASATAGTAAPLVAQAVPDVDIFLVDLVTRNGTLTATGARNLTSRIGYDNQPSWSRDGRAIYFTSIGDDAQADIYRMDRQGAALARVTMTAESEYSATVVPGGSAISVIRVERDSTQRLWRVPLDGGADQVILADIKPVGYHTWASESTLALFVLGSPNTLQLARTSTGRADTIITSIGRSLHTTRDGSVSFVHKVSAEEWWLMLLDTRTRAMQRLVQMPLRVEDYAWLPDGRVVAGEGSILRVFDPRTGGSWETVADLAQFGIRDITRLAVSPSGDAIAVVAVERR
jgi:dipeptidyl aminopeptidase/acylaminoacyl peptidase